MEDKYSKSDSGIYVPTKYNYFVKPTEHEMSIRKLEYYNRLAEIQRWGIHNPTKFLKEFIGIELLDSQEYIFMNSWNKPFVLWLESRNAGKSTLIALLLMAKGLLFNNYRAYICSGTASQSQETFLKIESIAKNAIDSMLGLTDYFAQEVVINNASGDGFLHNPMGFTYSLFNGSFVKTLNSNVDGQRGKIKIYKHYLYD